MLFFFFLKKPQISPNICCLLSFRLYEAVTNNAAFCPKPKYRDQNCDANKC